MRKPNSFDSEDDPEYTGDGYDVDYDAEFYSGPIAPKTRPDRLEDYALNYEG